MVSSWKCWIVIAPWDIGVRVRLGKVASELKPGLHFRIPMLDEIVLVNTRLRIEPTPTVTVRGSRPNTARVVTAQVGYLISAPMTAMLRYTTPGAALLSMAQAKVAEGATPEETRLALEAEFRPNGVQVVYVYYTEDVEVRTYRLLTSAGGGVYSHGTPMPMGPDSHGVSGY